MMKNVFEKSDWGQGELPRDSFIFAKFQQFTVSIVFINDQFLSVSSGCSAWDANASKYYRAQGHFFFFFPLIDETGDPARS